MAGAESANTEAEAGPENSEIPDTTAEITDLEKKEAEEKIVNVKEEEATDVINSDTKTNVVKNLKDETGESSLQENETPELDEEESAHAGNTKTDTTKEKDSDGEASEATNTETEKGED